MTAEPVAPKVRPISPELLAMAKKIAETPDRRTEEEIIRDGVAFVMGPGGDEGTRMVRAEPVAPVTCNRCGRDCVPLLVCTFCRGLICWHAEPVAPKRECRVYKDHFPAGPCPATECIYPDCVRPAEPVAPDGLPHVDGKWCADLHCRRCYGADTWQKSEVTRLKSDLARAREDAAKLRILAAKYIDCYVRQVNVPDGIHEADRDRAYVSQSEDAARSKEGPK